ncbi:MAG: hypothetical protein KKH92_08865 [Firmicutes bacterium]|nr:hypothetical protein [Bacillota bacterium]
MKKLMSFILLCFITVLFGIISSFAGQYDELPKGKNYLSLSNVRILDNPSEYSETIDPIKVKPNVNYTLVFDFDFLGQHTQDLDRVFVEIEELHGYDRYTNYLIVDFLNEIAYIEFMPGYEWIHIKLMPNGAQNAYNVMLYEGIYADFEGFVPYVHPSEVMSYQGLIPMDYDNLLTMDQIKSNITARNSLGQAMAYDVIQDTYSPSLKLPGSYQMMFEVTHNLITKKYILDIRVYDITSPMISIPTPIEIPLAEKIDVSQIKSRLNVTDNVDSIATSSLSILEDTYTEATTIGTYHILVEASDSAGNKTTLEVPVTLIDRKGPVIYGSQLIYLYTTDSPLTNAQILSRYYATDDVDGNVNVSITYNIYNQTVLPGVYQISLTSSDSAMNVTNRTINIHVIENKGPIFETNDQVIEKSVSDTMSDADIIAWFKAQLELSGIESDNVTILLNEYESNEKLSGSYYVYLKYESNGLEQTSRVRIDVIEEENTNPYLLYISVSSGVLLLGFGVAYYVKKKRI